MHNTTASQLNLERIIDHLDGSILCCKNDAVLSIVYASAYFYKTLGYENGEVTSLLGDNPESILRNDPPVDCQKLGAELRRNGFAERELKLIRKDGHHIWACCRIRLLTDKDGEEYLCGLLFDVTQKHRFRKKEREQIEAIKKAESELEASEQRYRLIMEQAADPIFDYDLKTRQIYCSPSFQARFDFHIYDESHLYKLRESDFLFEEDRERAFHDLAEALKEDKSSPRIGEYRLKNLNGRYGWYRLRSTVIHDGHGAPVRIIIFFTDIDKQKKETMLLRERAERDLLTGLYNHVTTTSRIDKVLAESKNGSRHALFVIDIDNFKNVNDQLGHLLGDEVIEEIASKLKDQFREDDIIGRIGGDEFVVFLQNIPSDKILRMKSRILNELFRGTQTDGAMTCKVSCSVGVSVYPTDGSNYHELFRKADIAMYAAKNRGKDICCIYTRELESAAHQNHNN